MLVPYLKPNCSAKKYTLALDLDETLIYYTEELGHQDLDPDGGDSNEEPVYFVRPGLHSFLSGLSRYYEIVLFTAADRDYADYFI